MSKCCVSLWAVERCSLDGRPFQRNSNLGRPKAWRRHAPVAAPHSHSLWLPFAVAAHITNNQASCFEKGNDQAARAFALCLPIHLHPLHSYARRRLFLAHSTWSSITCSRAAHSLSASHFVSNTPRNLVSPTPLTFFTAIYTKLPSPCHCALPSAS